MVTAGFSRRAASSAYQVIWKVADWAFPPVCAGCGTNGYSWCPDCAKKTSPIQEPVCSICGVPDQISGICRKCRKSTPFYDSLRSYSDYAEPLRSAIIRMKTYPDYGLGLALSYHLLDLFMKLSWNVDLIVPVPISKDHFDRRGFNQTDLFAYPLALSLGISYKKRAVTRIRETRSQVGLSATERVENVSGAFEAVASQVMAKTVLVVDDVATTGSSISSCANALKNAGATRVLGLSLARPLLKESQDFPIDV